MSDQSRRANSPMSGADALLWTVGRDPVLRPTILAVMVLDSPPRWADVRARMAALVDAVPRLRSCVAMRPFGCRREFVVDDGFDLDSHLHRTSLPAGATLRHVLDLAQTMASAGFDAERPPWEAVMVEGVDGSSAALVVKLHHALVDGVGGVAVLAHLLDHAGRPSPERDPVTGGRGKRPRPVFLRHVPTPRRMGEVALYSCGHPLRQMENVVATATSVARLLAPAGRPLSPLMTKRSDRRGCEVLDLDPQVLRGAARAMGGTLNDVFVASVVLGLARYHERHGVRIDGLRALMPINVRASGDPLAGNHFVPARFIVPVYTDPARCVREVHAIAASWKTAPGLAMNEVLATGLDALPDPVVTALWGSMLKGDDFCVTNVPGPAFEAYLAGSRISQMYAFAPPSGAATNVSLITLPDRACVGIVTDVEAIPDSAELADCLAEGFDDVGGLRRGPEGTPS
jgi:diacylglycerol O-acyltransferase / wax synthase